MLQHDGLACLTRDNKDLKEIHPNFGSHSRQRLLYGIEPSEQLESMTKNTIYISMVY